MLRMYVPQDGIFAVYKPVGSTSYDVLRAIKTATRIKKIGHGGTLDPLAEGVLVVATGSATKELGQVLKGEDKEYLATIELGKVSPTHDSEGPVSVVQNVQEPSTKRVERVVAKYVGSITQRPPSFSAVKVRGVPAYKRKRRGEHVEIKSRTVTIHSIHIHSYIYPMLKLRVVCGSGVYIRSLAHDIGADVGTGGYLSHLVRTRVGRFTLEQASSLERITEHA